MFSNILKKYLIVTSLLFINYFLIPQQTFAAELIEITDFPSDKIAGEEFEVDFDVSGFAMGSYYMKGLGGPLGGSLIEVDTWNGGWLQQNGDWNNMPLFEVASESTTSATIKVRFDPNVASGNKDFNIRIRKTGTDDNKESSKVLIIISAATPSPSPSLSPVSETPTPTNTPNSTPTKTPSPKPNATKTSTPKTTPIKTTTAKPTPTPTEEATEEPTPESLDLTSSISNNSTSTPLGVVAGISTSKKMPPIANILILTGAGFLLVGGYGLYKKKKNEYNRESVNKYL